MPQSELNMLYNMIDSLIASVRVILSHVLGCGRWYGHLTMEVMLATLISRDIKVQGGQAEELYQQAQAVVNRVVRDTGGQFSTFLSFGGEIEQGGLCSTLVYLSVSVCMCVPPVSVAGMPWLTKVIGMIQPFTKMGQGISYLINFLKKVVDARCKQSTPAVSE